MFKIIIIAFTLLVSSCYDALEKRGLVFSTELENSNNMEIKYAGLDCNYIFNKIVQIKYNITVYLPNYTKLRRKYIIVEYPDPLSPKKPIKELIFIDGKSKFYSLQTKPVYGFKRNQIYNVRIDLTEDQYGHQILEQINQTVKADCIPQGFKNSL